MAQAVAGMGFDDMNGLAASIQGAASAALLEFAMSTLAQAASGINNTLGLQGNVDGSSLLAISRKGVQPIY